MSGDRDDENHGEDDSEEYEEEDDEEYDEEEGDDEAETQEDNGDADGDDDNEDGVNGNPDYFEEDVTRDDNTYLAPTISTDDGILVIKRGFATASLKSSLDSLASDAPIRTIGYSSAYGLVVMIGRNGLDASVHSTKQFEAALDSVEKELLRKGTSIDQRDASRIPEVMINLSNDSGEIFTEALIIGHRVACITSRSRYCLIFDLQHSTPPLNGGPLICKPSATISETVTLFVLGTSTLCYVNVADLGSIRVEGTSEIIDPGVDEITALALSPSELHLAVGSSEGSVGVISVTAGEWIEVAVVNPDEQPTAICWGAPETILVGFGRESVMVYHLGKDLRHLKEQGGALGGWRVRDPCNLPNPSPAWPHSWYFDYFGPWNCFVVASNHSSNVSILGYWEESAEDFGWYPWSLLANTDDETCIKVEVVEKLAFPFCDRPIIPLSDGSGFDDRVYITGCAWLTRSHRPVAPIVVLGEKKELEGVPDFKPPPCLLVASSTGVVHAVGLVDRRQGADHLAALDPPKQLRYHLQPAPSLTGSMGAMAASVNISASQKAINEQALVKEPESKISTNQSNGIIFSKPAVSSQQSAAPSSVIEFGGGLSTGGASAHLGTMSSAMFGAPAGTIEGNTASTPNLFGSRSVTVTPSTTPFGINFPVMPKSGADSATAIHSATSSGVNLASVPIFGADSATTTSSAKQSGLGVSGAPMIGTGSLTDASIVQSPRDDSFTYPVGFPSNARWTAQPGVPLEFTGSSKPVMNTPLKSSESGFDATTVEATPNSIKNMLERLREESEDLQKREAALAMQKDILDRKERSFVEREKAIASPAQSKSWTKVTPMVITPAKPPVTRVEPHVAHKAAKPGDELLEYMREVDAKMRVHLRNLEGFYQPDVEFDKYLDEHSPFVINECRSGIQQVGVIEKNMGDIWRSMDVLEDQAVQAMFEVETIKDANNSVEKTGKSGESGLDETVIRRMRREMRDLKLMLNRLKVAETYLRLENQRLDGVEQLKQQKDSEDIRKRLDILLATAKRLQSRTEQILRPVIRAKAIPSDALKASSSSALDLFGRRSSSSSIIKSQPQKTTTAINASVKVVDVTRFQECKGITPVTRSDVDLVSFSLPDRLRAELSKVDRDEQNFAQMTENVKMHLADLNKKMADLKAKLAIGSAPPSKVAIPRLPRSIARPALTPLGPPSTTPVAAPPQFKGLPPPTSTTTTQANTPRGGDEETKSSDMPLPASAPTPAATTLLPARKPLGDITTPPVDIMSALREFYSVVKPENATDAALTRIITKHGDKVIENIKTSYSKEGTSAEATAALNKLLQRTSQKSTVSTSAPSQGLGVSSSGFGSGFGASLASLPSTGGGMFGASTAATPVKPAVKSNVFESLGGGGSGGMGGMQSGGATHETQMRKFYEKTNPSKVGEVPDILRKYQGQELALWGKLKTKYPNDALYADQLLAEIKPAQQSSSGGGFGALGGSGGFGGIGTPGAGTGFGSSGFGQVSGGGGFGTPGGGFGSTMGASGFASTPASGGGGFGTAGGFSATPAATSFGTVGGGSGFASATSASGGGFGGQGLGSGGFGQIASRQANSGFAGLATGAPNAFGGGSSTFGQLGGGGFGADTGGGAPSFTKMRG